ncbi:copper chaperone PCu(A)C [Paracraurococcus ruber]|uniref:copper chaperone PCu(A)C n=1 Tax=Paracraurococcus ruber TaxID=77675 RepID=UPI001F0209B0|nr:copper chaperone PCu(A)C [Paracraurococcus ruber]
MTRRTLLLLGLTLAAAPALAQHAPPQQVGDIAVAHPWTRAAGQGGTGAGFLAISNRGAVADRLVGVATPAARVAELHTHIRDGEVMRMRPVPAIDLPAGQTVTLQPGGLHLMLIGLAQPLVQGQSVPVTLRFERAGEVTVQLQVQAAGARGPAH